MKKLLFLVCLMFLQLTFSQTKYTFDYTLVFKTTNFDKNTSKQTLYAVNSADNSNSLKVYEKDSLNYMYNFIDYNGVSVAGKVNKQLFYKAETLANNCKQTAPFRSQAKEKVATYDFINLADTIINDTSYYHYVIKSNQSLKYRKKRNIVTTHFIVDKFSPNFASFLPQAIMYETLKKGVKIPNGIPKTILFLKYDNTKDSQLDLVKAVKVDKYLTIPEDCIAKTLQDKLQKVY